MRIWVNCECKIRAIYGGLFTVHDVSEGTFTHNARHVSADLRCLIRDTALLQDPFKHERGLHGNAQLRLYASDSSRSRIYSNSNTSRS